MAAARKQTPAYRLHKTSGRAVVTLDGRDHYLGPFGARESRDEYDRIIAGWLANGRQMPDEPHQPATVAEVLLAYLKYCEVHYAARRRCDGILSAIKLALCGVRETCGTTPAASFGPKSGNVSGVCLNVAKRSRPRRAKLRCVAS
jgi:hypothetical protein